MINNNDFKKNKNNTDSSFIQYGKLPPQAVDLEEAVLGAILIEGNALSAVIDFLKSDAFYKDAHQRIFKAILSLFAKSEPVDILTVTNELRKANELEIIGGTFYISSLTNRVVSAANIEYHARIISQKYIQRELIRTSTEIIQNAYEDETDVFDLLEYTEKTLFEIFQNNIRGSFKTIPELIKANIKTIEKASKTENHISGVQTGFTEVDRITSGWQKTDLIIIAARPGMGKALTLDSDILTNRGWVKMGNIKIEDKVCSDDGNFYNILGIYPQGLRDVYRVTLDDKTYIDCDIDHLWETTSRTEKKRKIIKSSIKTTKQIIDSGVVLNDGRNNHSLRFCNPINYPNKELLINPYLMGIYLGDGFSKLNSIMFSNNESDIINKISNILPDTDRLEKYKGGKFEYIVKPLKYGGISIMSKYIKHYGLLNKKSNAKFIPKDFLYSGIKDRIKLLQGLVDTDGYVSSPNHLEYSTVSEQLKDDILDLIRGLGGKASYKILQGAYTKNGERIEVQKYYRIVFSFKNGFMPVSSSKHIKKFKGQKKYHSKYITDISYIGKKECQCISINSPSHLYLTNNYTITHNTAFVLSMARNISIDFKKSVALFSLEMSAEQLVNRLMASESEIDSEKLRSGNLNNNEWNDLNNNMTLLCKSKIIIDDTPSLTVIELRAKCRRLMQKFNIELIIVDYLQLLVGKDKTGNRDQEIGFISRSLKSIAKEMNVPVIALSQLSRNVENRADKRPQLSDLRESGNIEQDADIVVFLYRESYYDKSIENGYTETIFAKHRNGKQATVNIEFVPKYVKFQDISDYSNYNQNSLKPSKNFLNGVEEEKNITPPF